VTQVAHEFWLDTRDWMLNRRERFYVFAVLAHVAAWVAGCVLLALGIWALFHCDVPHVQRNVLLLNVCLFYLWLSKNLAMPPQVAR
jgi:hypothetical protein